MARFGVAFCALGIGVEAESIDTSLLGKRVDAESIDAFLLGVRVDAEAIDASVLGLSVDAGVDRRGLRIDRRLCPRHRHRRLRGR